MPPMSGPLSMSRDEIFPIEGWASSRSMRDQDYISYAPSEHKQLFARFIDSVNKATMLDGRIMLAFRPISAQEMRRNRGNGMHFPPEGRETLTASGVFLTKAISKDMRKIGERRVNEVTWGPGEEDRVLRREDGMFPNCKVPVAVFESPGALSRAMLSGFFEPGVDAAAPVAADRQFLYGLRNMPFGEKCHFYGSDHDVPLVVTIPAEELKRFILDNERPHLAAKPMIGIVESGASYNAVVNRALNRHKDDYRHNEELPEADRTALDRLEKAIKILSRESGAIPVALTQDQAARLGHPLPDNPTSVEVLTSMNEAFVTARMTSDTDQILAYRSGREALVPRGSMFEARIDVGLLTYAVRSSPDVAATAEAVLEGLHECFLQLRDMVRETPNVPRKPEVSLEV